MIPKDIIGVAVEACGGRTELATHLGVSTSSIDKWRTLNAIPARHCSQLFRLTQIPLSQMNPDVFDPEFTLSNPWEIRTIGKLRQLRQKKGGFRLLKDIENMIDLNTL